MEITATKPKLPPGWDLCPGTGGRDLPVIAGFGCQDDQSSASGIGGRLFHLREKFQSKISPYVDEEYPFICRQAHIYVFGLNPLLDKYRWHAGSIVVCEVARLTDAQKLIASPSIYRDLLSAFCDVKVLGTFSTRMPQPNLFLAEETANSLTRPVSGIRTHVSAPRALPVVHVLHEIESSLQLTRSQLAQSLQVERATLYQWFRGALPRQKTITRIEQLSLFAKEWRQAGLGSARGYWSVRSGEAASPLGDLLGADQIDFDQLRALIHTASQNAAGLGIVEPAGIEGFAAENAVEERRRNRDLFPPTFADEE